MFFNDLNKHLFPLKKYIFLVSMFNLFIDAVVSLLNSINFITEF